MRLPMMIAMLGVMGLAACGGRERDITLREFQMNRSSPEEFSILPGKPLQMPGNLAALPQPTPGGTNITDPTPLRDAVATLGGDPARLAAGGQPRDPALIGHVGRFGVDGNIRQDLAAEDLEFRKRKSRFTWRLVPEDEYNRAYRREMLDPYREVERFRRAGARTPSSPPGGR